MEEIKKQINKLWMGSIFTSFVFAVIGILLFLKPMQIIKILSTIVGIFMIIVSIFALVKYFSTKIKDFFGIDLVYGVISMVAGTLLISNPEAVASIFPLVLGVWMVINSVMKLQYAFALREYQNTSFIPTIIVAFLTLALGVLFIFNPFKGAAFLMQLLGISITIYAILDILNACFLKKSTKKIKKAIIDAEIVEDE